MGPQSEGWGSKPENVHLPNDFWPYQSYWTISICELSDVRFKMSNHRQTDASWSDVTSARLGSGDTPCQGVSAEYHEQIIKRNKTNFDHIVEICLNLMNHWQTDIDMH